VTLLFTDPTSGVAWVAHVTGFVIGVVVTLVVMEEPRDRGG
jgi:membrane associated rhomboid family serine protease